MEKLVIKLKQHTPLIHFQHDQEGATLRASEVKPKLDRYLIENEFENEFENCKMYLIGYENTPSKESLLKKKFKEGFHSLNYKIKVETKGEKEDFKLQSECRIDPKTRKRKYYSYWRRSNNGSTEEFPILLSNMGGKEQESDLINFSFYEDITITFYTKEKELSDIISYYIDLFFATNNFGQRSSKGFGSFSIIEINGEKKEFPFEEFENIYKLSYTSSKNIDLSFQAQLFQSIDFYWKCLKSGINYTRNNQYPKRYIKAFLWTYLNNKQSTWEKRKIKECFDLTTGGERKENTNRASFARAILGCPDKFEYKNKGKTISINHHENPKSPNFIARIPSPIVFKPIIMDAGGNRHKVIIFLIIEEKAIQRLQEMNNLDFEFKCQNSTLLLDIDPKIIDVKELIKQYHQHIKKENWGRKAFNNEQEYEEFVDNNDLSVKTWFFPLDFNWRRILKSPIIIKK